MEELATIMVQEEATTTVEEGSKEKSQGVRKRTRKSKSSKGDMGKDNNNGNDKVTAEEKDKETSSPPPPPWDYLCVREIENAKRERIEKMGQIPAFEADMAALAENYGRMAAEGKAFLATMSSDSDDETEREICARRAKLGRSNS
jgi:hypothetical protein